MRLVILESPYSARTFIGRWLNRCYARQCLRDALARGEAPIASHLLYAQVLDDRDPAQRSLAIAAGLAWRKVAEASVVYVDRGVSDGMKFGIETVTAAGLPVERRAICQTPSKRAFFTRNGDSPGSHRGGA